MSYTLKVGWQLARSVEAADDPLLAAATMDSMPSGAAGIANRDISSIEMIMAAAGSEGGTVTARVWTGRDGPPARLVAEVVFTLGAMVVNQDPQTLRLDHGLDYYADTVAKVQEAWHSGVSIGKDNGNDRLGVLIWDVESYGWMFVEVVEMVNVTKANFYFGYKN